MKNRRRNFALCGAICGIIYIVNLYCPLPDFLRGFALGLAISFLLLAALPDKVLERLRKLKMKAGMDALWITKINR